MKEKLSYTLYDDSIKVILTDVFTGSQIRETWRFILSGDYYITLDIHDKLYHRNMNNLDEYLFIYKKKIIKLCPFYSELTGEIRKNDELIKYIRG